MKYLILIAVLLMGFSAWAKVPETKSKTICRIMEIRTLTPEEYEACMQKCIKAKGASPTGCMHQCQAEVKVGDMEGPCPVQWKKAK